MFHGWVRFIGPGSEGSGWRRAGPHAICQAPSHPVARRRGLQRSSPSQRPRHGRRRSAHLTQRCGRRRLRLCGPETADSSPCQTQWLRTEPAMRLRVDRLPAVRLHATAQPQARQCQCGLIKYFNLPRLQPEEKVSPSVIDANTHPVRRSPAHAHSSNPHQPSRKPSLLAVASICLRPGRSYRPHHASISSP
jgi:hypothetical protein